MTTALRRLGMKLAVPYNHDPAVLAAVEERREDVEEIYLPAPPDVVGSGRLWSGPDPEDYRRALPEIGRRMAEAGVKVNLAMNAVYVAPQQYGEVVAFIAEAVDAGVTHATLADASLAEAVRDAYPDLGIVVSTIAEVYSIPRARHWRNRIGAERIVLPRNFNKSPDPIRQMAKLGMAIEILVNEFCLPACAYYRQHAYAIGGCGTSDPEAADHFQMNCWDIKSSEPWEHYQTEIVPAEVPHLEGLADVIKLAGRGRPTDFILGEIDRFIRLEDTSHGIFGYDQPAPVWDKVATCDRHCEECGYCPAMFRKANPDFTTQVDAWLARHPIAERNARHMEEIERRQAELED